MKVNPIGIQSYQQLTRQQRPSQEAGDKPQSQQAQERVEIQPQQEAESSKLAVKASGRDFAQYLSPQEREALDMLFSKFRDGERFGPKYAAGSETAEERSPLGRHVDLKV